jgi:hypothetical protein
MSSKEPIVNCPHCAQLIVIEAVNCAIFRCGVLKQNGLPIHPHTPKHICDQLVSKDIIYGCGKPFKLELVDNEYTAVVCDYI